MAVHKIFLLLLLLPTIEAYYLTRACGFLDRLVCENADRDDYKFCLAEGSMYDRDNKSIACFEVGTEVSLKSSRSLLRVLDYGFLNMIRESIMSIDHHGRCSVTDRSVLSNMGNLSISSAAFDMWFKSETLNYGLMSLENGSALTVHEHGTIKVSPTAKLLMSPMSDVKVFTHAQIILCANNNSGDTQALLLKGESKLTLTEDAKLIIVKGQVLLQEKSHIDISEQGYMEVHGELKLSKKSGIFLWKRAGLLIGPVNKTESHVTTSLIFNKEEIHLYIEDECSLVLKPGLHCLLKKTYYVKSLVALNDTTKNDYMECFESKEKLTTALGKKPS